MAPLKIGMSLRDNTIYMKIITLNGCNEQTLLWKFIIKKNYKYAANLIIHDHHLIKGSRVITLDKLTSNEIYLILISNVKNKHLVFIPKICLMTMILTGQQLICFHALPRVIPINDLFDTKS